MGLLRRAPGGGLRLAAVANRYAPEVDAPRRAPLASTPRRRRHDHRPVSRRPAPRGATAEPADSERPARSLGAAPRRHPQRLAVRPGRAALRRRPDAAAGQERRRQVQGARAPAAVPARRRHPPARRHRPRPHHRHVADDRRPPQRQPRRLRLARAAVRRPRRRRRVPHPRRRAQGVHRHPPVRLLVLHHRPQGRRRPRPRRRRRVPVDRAAQGRRRRGGRHRVGSRAPPAGRAPPLRPVRRGPLPQPAPPPAPPPRPQHRQPGRGRRAGHACSPTPCRRSTSGCSLEAAGHFDDLDAIQDQVERSEKTARALGAVPRRLPRLHPHGALPAGGRRRAGRGGPSPRRPGHPPARAGPSTRPAAAADGRARRRWPATGRSGPIARPSAASSSAARATAPTSTSSTARRGSPPSMPRRASPSRPPTRADAAHRRALAEVDRRRRRRAPVARRRPARRPPASPGSPPTPGSTPSLLGAPAGLGRRRRRRPGRPGGGRRAGPSGTHPRRGPPAARRRGAGAGAVRGRAGRRATRPAPRSGLRRRRPTSSASGLAAAAARRARIAAELAWAGAVAGWIGTGSPPASTSSWDPVHERLAARAGEPTWPAAVRRGGRRLPGATRCATRPHRGRRRRRWPSPLPSAGAGRRAKPGWPTWRRRPRPGPCPPATATPTRDPGGRRPVLRARRRRRRGRPRRRRRHRGGARGRRAARRVGPRRRARRAPRHPGHAAARRRRRPSRPARPRWPTCSCPPPADGSPVGTDTVAARAAGRRPRRATRRRPPGSPPAAAGRSGSLRGAWAQGHRRVPRGGGPAGHPRAAARRAPRRGRAAPAPTSPPPAREPTAQRAAPRRRRGAAGHAAAARCRSTRPSGRSRSAERNLAAARARHDADRRRAEDARAAANRLAAAVAHEATSDGLPTSVGDLDAVLAALGELRQLLAEHRRALDDLGSRRRTAAAAPRPPRPTAAPRRPTPRTRRAGCRADHATAAHELATLQAARWRRRSRPCSPGTPRSRPASAELEQRGRPRGRAGAGATPTPRGRRPPPASRRPEQAEAQADGRPRRRRGRRSAPRSRFPACCWRPRADPSSSTSSIPTVGDGPRSPSPPRSRPSSTATTRCPTARSCPATTASARRSPAATTPPSTRSTASRSSTSPTTRGRQPLAVVAARLAEEADAARGRLAAREREVLERFLLRELADEVRSKLLDAHDLVTGTNRTLAGVSTSHGKGAHLEWKLRDDAAGPGRGGRPPAARRAPRRGGRRRAPRRAARPHRRRAGGRPQRRLRAAPAGGARLPRLAPVHGQGHRRRPSRLGPHAVEPARAVPGRAAGALVPGAVRGGGGALRGHRPRRADRAAPAAARRRVRQGRRADPRPSARACSSTSGSTSCSPASGCGDASRRCPAWRSTRRSATPPSPASPSSTSGGTATSATSSACDRPRSLDRPGLGRLWDLVAERLQRNGLRPQGTVRLDGLDRDERHALAGLLGRPVADDGSRSPRRPRPAPPRQRRRAGLVAAAERLRGPLVDRPGRRQARAEATARVWAAGRATPRRARAWPRRRGSSPGSRSCAAPGRWGASRPERAERALATAARCAAALPAPHRRRALRPGRAGVARLRRRPRARRRHAARRRRAAGGGGHRRHAVSVDSGGAAGAVAARWACSPTRCPRPRSPPASARPARTSWLDDRTDAGWESHLTLRDLRRLDLAVPAGGVRVRVREPAGARGGRSTPAVGARSCAPWASRRSWSRPLLERLAAAGAELRYHGDFDWPGITIANVLVGTHRCRPWRFGAADYVEALARLGADGRRAAPVGARAHAGLLGRRAHRRDDRAPAAPSTRSWCSTTCSRT